MVLVFVSETHMFFYSVSNLCTQTSFQACVLFLKLTFEHLIYSLNPHSVFFHFMLVEHSDLLPYWRVAFVLVVDGQSVRVPLACHTDTGKISCQSESVLVRQQGCLWLELTDVGKFSSFFMLSINCFATSCPNLLSLDVLESLAKKLLLLCKVVEF